MSELITSQTDSKSVDNGRNGPTSQARKNVDNQNAHSSNDIDLLKMYA